MRRSVILLLLATPAAGGSLPPGTTPIVPFRSDGPDAQWLVSDWPAGQSPIVAWSPKNISADSASGALELVLDAGAPGERPYRGAEFQSTGVATYGRWGWYATAPEMTDGAVFGMFLYRADHENDPWREYDFEFVGADTSKVELNIHFEEPTTGGHVSLAEANGGPIVVDLGFDASDAPHLYEIEVSHRQAIFSVDGEVVGEFGPDDMPGGVWSDGQLRSFVDLWAVGPNQEAWAGPWHYSGEPLTARIYATSLPEGSQ